MPTFRVQDNPYWRPSRGRNLITDRLLAGLQSFSAPKEGAYGPKAGFFSSLVGNDRNRMNVAEQMRGQDINAGNYPFQQEATQEENMSRMRFGAAEEIRRLQEQAAAARNNARIEAQQAMNTERLNQAASEARWKEVGEADQAMQGQAHNLLRDRLNNVARLERVNTPRPMSEFERFAAGNPKAVGGSIYYPGTGLTVTPPSMYNPGGTFDKTGTPFDPTTIKFGDEEISFLNGDDEQSNDDGDLLNEVLNYP